MFSIISSFLSGVQFSNFSTIFFGKALFTYKLISCFPKKFPLASSPAIYPKEGAFSIIFSPSKIQEFDPVPKIHEIIGVPL